MNGIDGDEAQQIAELSYAAERAGVRVAEVVLPRDVDIVLGTMRFHYLDWGNESRRPIVFLHGRGLTAHTFDLVCLQLRSDYHCLALDQRGHGDSEWSPTGDYSFETQARDLYDFIDKLDLQGLVLVGMSMGGLNALRYAGSSEAALSALVIIDIGPEIQSTGSARIRRFMAQPKEAESMDAHIRAAIALNPRRDPVLLRRSFRHNLRREPGGKWTWKWDPRPRERSTQEQRDNARSELWTDVARVACPTLIVRGEKSDIFSEDDALRLASRLPIGHAVTVEGAGHSVQGDNPKGLVIQLRRFLTDIGL